MGLRDKIYLRKLRLRYLIPAFAGMTAIGIHARSAKIAHSCHSRECGNPGFRLDQSSLDVKIAKITVCPATARPMPIEVRSRHVGRLRIVLQRSLPDRSALHYRYRGYGGSNRRACSTWARKMDRARALLRARGWHLRIFQLSRIPARSHSG